MSATAAAAAAPGGGAPPPDDASDIEARARVMGWKPKEEFHGRGEWRPAAEFLERAEADGRIIRERYGALERRFANLERSNAELARKNEEAISVISDLTERTRNVDERAYKRARRELEAERDEAIRTGDVNAVRTKDAELAELDATKPAPAKPPPQPAKPGNGEAQPPHPDAVAWAAKNAWYNSNPQLHQMVLGIHQRLLADQPDLSVAENLERVTRTMHAMYPDIVPAPDGARAPVPPPPDPEPEPDNPNRAAPAAVSPSSPSRGGARPNPRGFDAMPADSKAAYHKYAKQLEGKGKPLTKEEWAISYWQQFDE